MSANKLLFPSNKILRWSVRREWNYSPWKNIIIESSPQEFSPQKRRIKERNIEIKENVLKLKWRKLFANSFLRLNLGENWPTSIILHFSNSNMYILRKEYYIRIDDMMARLSNASKGHVSRVIVSSHAIRTLVERKR